ncbi:hypothetical protein T12_8361 [Trichinella patagoniensis]|uniref:Uncharacterized protein n=1 Tax=Trichinella patagoniensis TaxID=990121 RepID=A0A0V1A572_9BILA|nr:hypothetical protein T12_8361 [Trichinella patagoniensis]
MKIICKTVYNKDTCTKMQMLLKYILQKSGIFLKELLLSISSVPVCLHVTCHLTPANSKLLEESFIDELSTFGTTSSSSWIFSEADQPTPPGRSIQVPNPPARKSELTNCRVKNADV